MVQKQPCSSGLTTVRFHPDGGLFATGDREGIVSLWDISTQEEIVKLGEAGMPVSSLSFSENGFYLASCGPEDREIKLWDIRKNKVVKNFTLEGESYAEKVEFDYSGNFLAFSGYNFGILDVRSMSLVKEDVIKNGHFTSVKFGNIEDEFMISTCSTGELLIHS